MALTVWWFLSHGLIDLGTPIFPSERSVLHYYDYMTETGWGLLYSVLLGGAALALLVRPLSPEPALQIFVLAATLAFAAVVTLQLAHLIPALVALGVGVGVLAITGEVPAPRTFLRRPYGVWWMPTAVIAAATVPAVGYAALSVWAGWTGQPDARTWELLHWPAQGAFALAVVLVALLPVLRRRGHLAAWCAGVSAAWFGAVSIAYPAHAGSLGEAGGIAAIAWGVVYVATWELTLFLARRPVDLPAAQPA